MARLHVVGLPARRHDACAYATKLERFCRMMHDRGHQVTAYLAGANTIPRAPGVEVVEVLAADTMDDLEVGTTCRFDGGAEWSAMNRRAAAEVRERADPGDMLCITAGLCQQPLVDALPHLTPIEWAVGYGGTLPPGLSFRVFESSAWMHTVYGAQQGAHTADGRFYDDVIPNFYDHADFHTADKLPGRAVFLGRMIDRKGVRVAAEVSERLSLDLVLAGEGPDVPAYGTHVGHVAPAARARLLASASVVLVPTLYVEPFGGVAVEAMLSGTPVVATDWGAFRETVVEGVTGYRARTLQEFLDATRRCVDGEFDPEAIRAAAVARYSLDAVGPRYDRFLARLEDLAGDGWYTVREPALTT